MTNDINMQFSTGPDGQKSITFDMTAQHFETLKLLKDIPAWQLYRNLLIKAKEGYFASAISATETVPMAKTIGMVAGINFAINQLPALMAMYEAKQAKKIAEAEKKLNAPES